MQKAQKTGESILIEGCRSVGRDREREHVCVCVQMRKQLVWGKEIINRIFLFPWTLWLNYFPWVLGLG